MRLEAQKATLPLLGSQDSEIWTDAAKDVLEFEPNIANGKLHFSRSVIARLAPSRNVSASWMRARATMFKKIHVRFLDFNPAAG